MKKTLAILTVFLCVSALAGSKLASLNTNFVSRIENPISDRIEISSEQLANFTNYISKTTRFMNKTSEGRKELHGRIVSQVIQNGKNTVVYEDGYEHTEDFKVVKPKSIAERAAERAKQIKAQAEAAAKAAKAKREAARAKMPDALAELDRKIEQNEQTTNSVTVTITPQ
jgi:hypothetical protein